MKEFLYEMKQEEAKLTQKTEEELSSEIEKLKKHLSKKKDSLENILPKWFALTQEVSFRKIGLKHFQTQLVAGFHLHQGKIVEMKTGEGKTLSSTLPISLNALSQKGVHVVTVNDYLAERDQKWMGKIYQGLGLTVGLVKSSSSFAEKKKSYQSDITYVTNSELVFDYLRDSSVMNASEKLQRPFHYCILDELDSILIDEARTPLIISEREETQDLSKFQVARMVATRLEKEMDFQIDEKRKDISFTEKGYEKTLALLGKPSLYDPTDPWILEILNALKANYLFKLNRDYILLNNKIVIVDEFTGRVMEDRRWSAGIHEAIEAKENLIVQGRTKTKTSITYQNFFTLYPKLAGMTGTALTSEKEFQDIYNLQVVVVPPFKPLIRKDISDLVYQNELAKWKAVVQQSQKCYQKGQPLLIGTASVEKSELLSDLFEKAKIPHQILNAKPENVSRESEIIAQAGKRFAVTIATNMAGRGTDIILGGNSTFEVKQIFQGLFLEQKEPPKDKQEYFDKINEEYAKTSLAKRKLKEDILNLPYSLETASPTFQAFYHHLSQEISQEWKNENTLVKELGGLFVLGTERHETRRIDNQLRGRAGRQGDPGISQFFISLEDELMTIFGGKNIRKWVEYIMQDPEEPLESTFLTRSLDGAQEKVELYNYDIRKNVFQYDNILNTQRRRLFLSRGQLLCEKSFKEFFLRYSEYSYDERRECSLSLPERNPFFENHFDFYSSYLASTAPISNDLCYQEIWISSEAQFLESNLYQNQLLTNTSQQQILELIDSYWTEHLERMNYIRETINWRSYGQQNPLIEYNFQATESFKKMLNQIRSIMIYYFFKQPLITKIK